MASGLFGHRISRCPNTFVPETEPSWFTIPLANGVPPQRLLWSLTKGFCVRERQVLLNKTPFLAGFAKGIGLWRDLHLYRQAVLQTLNS